MRARLLLLAAALAAFGASLGSGFHFDDYAIFTNPSLTSPEGVLHIWGLASTRPLTYFTFWLDWVVGGNAPLLYHLLNLLLHLGAVLVAYECFLRLVSPRTALLAAALFAVHPIQAEAVNYVWARSIVLATLLSLASLFAWLDGRRWEAVGWFALALLAKEECAAFPLALLLIAPSVPHEKSATGQRWPAAAPLAAMLLLAVAAGARVLYALSLTPGAPAGIQAGISPAGYLLAQGPVILRYLRLLVVPYGFTVDPDIAVPPFWLGLAAWAAILALAAAAWRFRCRWFLAGLVLLIPSSSLFPAADLAADRRLYLPMVAFALAAALLLERIEPRAVALAVVSCLVLVSMVRTRVWMSEKSLWSEAVAHAPHKVRPKVQLARALPAAEALELLAKARGEAPDEPSIAAETGRLLLAEGQPDAALAEFGRALALDPRNALYLNNRGVALEALGQSAAARADFERALQIDPGLAEAKANLSKLLP